MTEDFLHFVWRTQNFNFQNLITTEGHPIEILDFGKWNTGAGPDFQMARIVLDNTEWFGNIEMHLSASEWNRHGHTTDPVYDTVVLHVVLEEDAHIYAGTRRIPCIELKDRIDHKLLSTYLRLLTTESWVPCAAHLGTIPALVLSNWLERMLVERIQSKTAWIYSLLDEAHDDWEEVFYQCLASAYGFKINSAPFMRLARMVPLRLIYKHQDSEIQLEALFYGAAGMLNNIFADEYPKQLQKEFLHLCTKYSLSPLPAHVWTWGKLRPPNFPNIRIAQFASIMKDFHGLFRKVLESSDIEALRSMFSHEVNGYWKTHSDFDKPTSKTSRRIGVQSVNGILINTIVPFLFCYGKRRGEDRYIESAVDIITSLPPEENAITQGWENISMMNVHAGHSQALIHLKGGYCDRRLCVSCAIGNRILTSPHS